MDLYDYLYENRISRTEFAKELDIPRTYLYRIMSGLCNPSLKLAKLINLYTDGNVKVDDVRIEVKKKKKNK